MKIAYDAVLKRPGCVLLQAAFGCCPTLTHHFETATWLLAPTPDLKVYEVTEAQLAKLVTITEEKAHAT